MTVYILVFVALTATIDVRVMPGQYASLAQCQAVQNKLSPGLKAQTVCAQAVK